MRAFVAHAKFGGGSAPAVLPNLVDYGAELIAEALACFRGDLEMLDMIMAMLCSDPNAGGDTGDEFIRWCFDRDAAVAEGLADPGLYVAAGACGRGGLLVPCLAATMLHRALAWHSFREGPRPPLAASSPPRAAGPAARGPTILSAQVAPATAALDAAPQPLLHATVSAPTTKRERRARRNAAFLAAKSASPGPTVTFVHPRPTAGTGKRKRSPGAAGDERFGDGGAADGGSGGRGLRAGGLGIAAGVAMAGADADSGDAARRGPRAGGPASGGHGGGGGGGGGGN
jgi:hypothetical protein